MDNDDNDSGAPEASDMKKNNMKNDISIYCYNDFVVIKQYSNNNEVSRNIIYSDTILDDEIFFINYI